MPYVEILAPPAPPQSKASLAKSITDGLMSAFGVDAQTITLYFLPIAPCDYAHAGEMGPQGTGQRILLKVHAFRRSAAERRAAAAALTRSVCSAYGVPGTDVATYFLDREKDEVAHDSKLASD
ncbi:phenylpyruvate tautomerase PptA (4-oxalocrotonate tautomerase family) [Bradyrhizobium algeriense]|jgi:phenylpyruvate tautomerase PptA (4-oxalocrotonate tautomerase family)|uniref:Phenylpyruvate tautomerase PptA (4-oxalocrotonate tautomerase family) n=1 Tax=Bradyrhizobium algeriense TaxID=634784 RepID=A0ABU8BFS2_9BRAD